MRAIALISPLFVLAAACLGTTGGESFEFPAAAAGPSDAVAGQPYAFDTVAGWHVVLTKASILVGAVYVDRSAPVSGAQNTPCVLPDTYLAQVTTGMTVDLLSPTPTPFPARGQGITGFGRVGQVWLVGNSDINAVDGDTTILSALGTAQQGADVRPFSATISIGSKRLGGGAVAGASPPCKQRIVSVPTQIAVQTQGGLLLRIDPKQLFSDVDFHDLKQVDASGRFVFRDDAGDTEDTASANLYSNLHEDGPLYTFQWVTGL
jgi:hypothetical protein